MNALWKSIAVVGAISASAAAGYLSGVRRSPPPEPPSIEAVAVIASLDLLVPRPPPPPAPAEEVSVPEPAPVSEAIPFPATARSRRRASRARPAAIESPAPAPEAVIAPEPVPKGRGRSGELLERALMAAERGNYRRAWGLLERALDRDPELAMGHLLAGVMAHVQGDLRRARQEYGEYLLREPMGARSAEVRKVLAVLEGSGHAAPIRVARR